jgi:hypothetical protein
VEPGSSSTIIGYGITDDYDVQATSDDYFSYAVLQIQNNLAIKHRQPHSW